MICLKVHIYFFLSLFFLGQVIAATTYEPQIILNRPGQVIWGFDFLDANRIIYTQRSGDCYVYNLVTKKELKLAGVPRVHAQGQGGLLDVKVHPTDRSIYFTYSEPAGEKSATALARATLQKDKLIWKKIFTALPASANPYHYGSRIAFDERGHVFITSGERGERPLVQRLDNHLGKIIRLNEDGSVPKDNPYSGAADKMKPEVWARGLRSPQGLAFRPETGDLWEAEMGPQGGDEVNMISAKADYGWPVITYGKEYEGPKIGEGTSRPGVEEPVAYWVPSISPSALTFYTGNKLIEWKGDAFLATLSGQHIRRLELAGNKVVSQEELFKDKGWRFRNLRTGPDGYLWFSTDEGKLGRIIKKPSP